MRVATFQHRQNSSLCLAVAHGDNQFIAVSDLLARTRRGVDPAMTDVLGRPTGTGWLAPDALNLLEQVAAEDAGHIEAIDSTLWKPAPPVVRPGKIIAVGRNYMDHVREGQEIWAKRGKVIELPKFPSAFAKYASSLAAHGDPIPLPKGEEAIDYEIELAVVIGAPAHNVDPDRALDHVAGYTICNDVGARIIQRREMEAQIGIVLAKNFPGFAPMGPWLVTSDEIPDPQVLDLRLEVDGEVRQHASTADMIFPVAELVSYWSRIGLETGDIIITGTPAGVALARDEPENYYLRAGQTVAANIEKIGTLTNPVQNAL